MKECPSCGVCADDAGDFCPEDGLALEPSLPGRPLVDGKYILERRLGSGGMGAVYRARHKDLQKTFALKVIRLRHLGRPDFLDRFRTEARALGKLQHPHIVQVTDYGVDAGKGDLPFLVMEHLDGETLDRRLERAGGLPAEEALAVAEAVAAAIDYAHARGVLHRDLKPQNIFLTGAPPEYGLKILDFGLARIAEDRAAYDEAETLVARFEAEAPPGAGEPPETMTNAGGSDGATLDLDSVRPAPLTPAGGLMGTPGYIAPEAWRGGGAGPAADIYSFGLIIYEVLSGRRLPGAGLGETARPSVPCPAFPRDLDPALLAPLDPDPRRRPRTATEVVRRLKRAYARSRYRTWRARAAPRRIGLAAGLTLVLLLLFGVLRTASPVRSAEHALADLRLGFLPALPPDDRILLVSVDEATLRADPALLADRADEMGVRLQGIMDRSPLGVGIDFLLPERWSRSPDFAALVLRHQKKLVLAGYVAPDGSLVGGEIFQGLILAALGSPDRAERILGFVNVAADEDGRIRTSPLGFRKKDGTWLPSLTARAYRLVMGRDAPAAAAGSSFRIDFSIDAGRYRRVSWKDLPRLFGEQPGLFRGRLVLVGGEYDGSQDYHRVPVRPGAAAESISGLTLQALALDTLLRNRPIRDVPPGVVAVLLGAAALFASFPGLMLSRVSRPLLACAGVAAAWFGASVVLVLAGRLLLPVALPLLLLALGLLAVLALRRKLTFVAKGGSGS